MSHRPGIPPYHFGPDGDDITLEIGGLQIKVLSAERIELGIQRQELLKALGAATPEKQAEIRAEIESLARRMEEKSQQLAAVRKEVETAAARKRPV